MTMTTKGNFLPGDIARAEVPAELTALDAARQDAAQYERALLARAGTFAYKVGIPVAVAIHILRLEDHDASQEARIEQLEKKLAALQGPPHFKNIEKR